MRSSLWKHHSGGQITQNAPVFSPKDAKFFFCFSHRQINQYQSQTGKKLGTYEYLKMDKDDMIVSIGFHTQFPTMLMACSSKGRICIWDWTDGSCLYDQQMIKSGRVQKMIIGSKDQKFFIWLLISTDKQERISKFSIQLTDSLEPKKHEEILILKSEKKILDFCLNEKQSHLFILKSHKCFMTEAHSYQNEQSAAFKIKKQENEELTCLAAHSTLAFSCAVGNQKGQIFYLNWKQLKVKPDVALMHWHANPLSLGSICFSEDGKRLWSFGSENVLVQWHLDSHEKSFISKCLPSAIPMGSACQVTLGWNEPTRQIWLAVSAYQTIKIISPITNETVSIVRGLQSTQPEAFRFYDDYSKQFYFTNELGQVQCWKESTGEETHLFYIGQAPMTSASSTSHKPDTPEAERMKRPQIRFLKVFQNQMMSIDQSGEEEYLKFWFLNQQQQNWQLKYKIQIWKQAGQVKTAFFRDSVCWLGFENGWIQKWQLFTDKEPQLVISQQLKYKSILSMDQSSDGSLLAILTPYLIIFYAAQSALSQPIFSLPLIEKMEASGHLLFSNTEPWLFCYSKHQFQCWDLRTQKVMLQYNDQKIEFENADWIENDLYLIFKNEDRKRSLWKLNMKKKKVQLKISLPKDFYPIQNSLYFLNMSDGYLCQLKDGSEVLEQQPKVKIEIPKEAPKNSLWAVDSKKSVKQEREQVYQTQKPVMDLSNSGSILNIFDDFMQKLLKEKSIEEEKEVKQEENEISVSQLDVIHAEEKPKNNLDRQIYLWNPFE